MKENDLVTNRAINLFIDQLAVDFLPVTDEAISEDLGVDIDLEPIDAL